VIAWSLEKKLEDVVEDRKNLERRKCILL